MHPIDTCDHMTKNYEDVLFVSASAVALVAAWLCSFRDPKNVLHVKNHRCTCTTVLPCIHLWVLGWMLGFS